MDLKQYENLKAQVEEAQRKVSQAEGALNQLTLQLKNEFNCDTLEQAEALLKQLVEKSEKLSEKHDLLLAKFEKWKEKMEE